MHENTILFKLINKFKVYVQNFKCPKKKSSQMPNFCHKNESNNNNNKLCRRKHCDCKGIISKNYQKES